MIYCICSDLLTPNSCNDDTRFQMKYAHALGCLVILNIETKELVTADGQSISINGDHVFLRSSTEHAFEAISIIEAKNGILLESAHDIMMINDWHKYVSPSYRKMISVNGRSEVYKLLSIDASSWLYINKIFIKSATKGLRKITRAQTLLDDKFWSSVSEHGRNYADEKLIISEFVNIQSDTIGKCEWRFFVLDGEIINSSRYIHSLRHIVHREVYDAAQHFVSLFKRIVGFPKNFVIDIMKVEDEHFDIVEVNPITTSMCYVNNSIFTIQLPQIKEIYNRTGYGYEFCLDAIARPNCYRDEAIIGESYCYE